MEVINIRKQSDTFVDHDWAEREQITSFGGQPLIFRGEILGVLAIFSRRHLRVLGETGTGKELIARELHRRSQRHKKPLIKVNCAAVPRELWNSEFLGHVKGAFTGAIKDRMGRLMAADGGSMFLDEVGETSLEHQSKLLRIIQEGEFERVGEEKTQKGNIRELQNVLER